MKPTIITAFLKPKVGFQEKLLFEQKRFNWHLMKKQDV